MQRSVCVQVMPNKTDCAVGGAAASVVAPAAVKTGALVAAKCAGFSPIGPVAGSYAASWMEPLQLPTTVVLQPARPMPPCKAMP